MQNIIHHCGWFILFDYHGCVSRTSNQLLLDRPAMAQPLLSLSLQDLLAWLGWGLLALGWLGQRPVTQHWVNKVQTWNWGSHNHVENHVSQQHHAAPADSGSALERWSNWATIAGLLVSLWPLLTKTPG